MYHRGKNGPRPGIYKVSIETMKHFLRIQEKKKRRDERRQEEKEERRGEEERRGKETQGKGVEKSEREKKKEESGRKLELMKAQWGVTHNSQSEYRYWRL